MRPDLGFDDDGNLRMSKGSDIEVVFPFPTTFSFNGYTGKLVIRANEDATTALLTVTQVATGAGSVITFDGSIITLLLKNTDISTLPEDAADNDDPWVGVYEWVNTDPDGLATRFSAGSAIAERGVVR